MNTEMITKTEVFLKGTFSASTYLQANPTDRDYRLEHSYRVANIAKAIAETEGFDVTYRFLQYFTPFHYISFRFPKFRETKRPIHL